MNNQEGKRTKKIVTGHEDPKAKNIKAAIEKVSIGSMHFSDLHDEDEDRAGQRIDEATGERIVNSSDPDSDTLTSIVDAQDITGEVKDGTEDDEAARWLRAHDGGK